VFVVQDDSGGYGAGLAAGFSEGIRARGIAIVGSAFVDSYEAALAAGAAAVAAAPDLVYYAGVGWFGIDFLPALHDAGYAGTVLTGDGMFEDAVAELGAAAENVVATTAGIDVARASKAGAAWTQAYTRRFGDSPALYAVYGYDAMKVILAALDRVCASGGSPRDRNAVRAAVMATRRFNAVSGRFSFDENGDTSNDAFTVYEVNGGAWTFAAHRF
jgi:branched-chain amino acid transport system substrate-binding protein